ncbi:hypothetical protein [Ureibacillus xyleni]|nr:hypothetical protein [Ureibacillus xyleni]
MKRCISVVFGLLSLLLVMTACTDNGDETPVEANSTDPAINEMLHKV